jgi:hypothetical protein
MSTMSDETRIQPRYDLAESFTVEVSVEAPERWAEPVCLTATVLNLSANGAKLAVPYALNRDENFRIRLVVERLGLSFYLSAQVCWSAPEGTAACVIGCRFSPNLPEMILQQLADGGRFDRRDRNRLPASAAVGIVRANSKFWSRETGHLHNYATGGVCVATDRTAALGETLTLRFGKRDGVDVPVIVRWVVEQDQQFLMGCEYSDRQIFESLKVSLA